MIHHTIIAAGSSDGCAAAIVVVAGVATALVINNYKTHARALALHGEIKVSNNSTTLYGKT